MPADEERREDTPDETEKATDKSSAAGTNQPQSKQPPQRKKARRKKAQPAQKAASPKDSALQDEKDEELIRRLGSVRESILDEIQKVIVGQEEVLQQLLIAMFCRAHVLMVGVPGLAKTLIVRTISRTMDLDFKRIQFTPDLMPSDITGTEILEIDPETQERQFKFQPGPIFTNILLADEINRTPPKTQAALLECMQEYEVTAAGTTYDIPRPFFVLATQNPIEQEGTYPLPEAQLDRFMFMVMVDYPERDNEIEIIRRTTVREMPEASQVMEASDILHVQDIVRRVPVSQHVLEYATDLVRATRPAAEGSPQFIKDWIEWGAGPRAAQYLTLGAKARAVMGGRFNVSCADVRSVAHPVLRHRILTNFNADSEGISEEDVIDKLLQNIPEPDEETYEMKAKRMQQEAKASKKAQQKPQTARRPS